MISTAQLSQKEFTGITLPQPYGQLLGKIPMDVSGAIWGPKGSGKSTMAVDLAYVLANEVGKGIYCSSEEGPGPSMQGKIQRLGAQHDDLLVTDFEGLGDLKSAIKYSQSTFVVLDSASMGYVKLHDFEQFHDWCKEQDVMLWYILHATKEGNYKGNTMMVHMPDIEIKVSDGIAETQKNRFEETPREMEVVFERARREKQEVKRENPDENDNIRQGIQSMKEVIETHTDVDKAMRHPKLGWISFVWGRKGSRGYGIAHIIENRNKEAVSNPIFDGQKGKDVAIRLPIVIGKGTLGEPYQNGEKRNIDHAGYRVVLRLDMDGNQKRWVLTGFRISKNRKNPDGAGEVQQFIQSYTPKTYMFMRSQAGAGLDLPQDTKNANKRENPADWLHGIPYIENPGPELRENKGIPPEDIYDMITDNIISVIEQEGELPWQKRYGTRFEHGMATNFVSKKAYRGINWIMLNFFKWIEDDGGKTVVQESFDSPYFLTFNQVDDLGGKVKKGAVAQRAFFFSLLYEYEQSDPDLEFSTFDIKEFVEWLSVNRSDIPGLPSGAGQAQINTFAQQSVIPIVRYYSLFNGDDIEGIDFGGDLDTGKLSDTDKIAAAESIFDHFPHSPAIKHNEQKPYYNRKNDVINMPVFGSYDEPQYYYSTLFHESVHSTGHKSRLDREFGKKFGDDKYAFEELVAEMGAAYLSAEAGILFRTLNQSAAYLKNWNGRLVEAMKEHNTFFFRAASRAQAAADYVLDRNEAGIPAYRKDLDLDSSDESAQEQESPQVPTFDGLIGDHTAIDFKADGSIQQKGEYAVLEAQQVIASHNKDCSQNSAHTISKGQPRDRSLDALCSQPKFIAQNLNPVSITQGNLAFNGAPTVLPDGQVIQGNGRSIALQIAYEQHPKQAKKYTQYLISHASDWGLDKKELKAFHQPVLVRMVDVSEDKAIELGNVVDTSQAKMSKVDQGKAYIRNLSKAKKQAIGNLINDSSGETLGEVISDVGIRIMDQFKDLDRQELVEDNELTAEGKDFLRSVFAGLVFDSDEHKQALQHFLKIKHRQKAGLERSYGNIIPFIGSKADLTDVIQQAVEIVSKVQNTDGINTAGDFLAQSDAFSGSNSEKFSKQAAQLAAFLLDADTQKFIRNGFRMYQWKINGKEDLFNPIDKVPPSKAFKAAFVDRVRINPAETLVYIAHTERLIIGSTDGKKELEGNFPTFVAGDKLYIVPSQRVEVVKDVLADEEAEQEFSRWHNYAADDIDFEIDFPSRAKAQPVGTAEKIWYASDKVIQQGDVKGKQNFYVHKFDTGRRPAVVKDDILIIGNITWNERGLLN